ncbi:unnamed protein product [Schistosoma margrebowiei]|uniref:5-azacytidine-induced protein 1 n=1 Tax=Schistosoma margrebowiei TaxID=48269 RepID=A0AA85AKT0_9TREM|nr:unnamed protein product [Schistosoma margrebowiei]
MNLSLKGSQISPCKSAISSSRSTARTYNDNSRTRNATEIIRSNKNPFRGPEVSSSTSEPLVKQKLESPDNLITNDDENPHIDFNNTIHADSLTFRRDKCGSWSSNSNDKSVSRWLETHFHDQNDSDFIWDGQHDDDILTPCSDKKGEDFNCGRNLDTIGDGLDLNINPKLGNICMDLNEVSGDDGDLRYADINEKTDTPPPCLVRPSSNSINTARQISGFNDELKLITSTSYDDNRRNSAATVIQKFWRRHRRYLAAEAVMYRLLDNQKRRLSKQNINNGRPIHSVLQSRQNELKQKRKQQHQNAIKILQENRSTKSSQRQETLEDKAEVNDVSESILVSGNQKDRTNEDESNILNKAIFTTNTNQCKTCSPDIHITTTTEQNIQNESEQVCRENNSLCQTEFCGLRKDGNNRALGQQKNVSGEKNMSAVDNILQELKQLESVEFLNHCSTNDPCIDVSKQVSLQKCPIPTTWSEMVKDISRVLSEAEQDEVHSINFRKYCTVQRSTGLNGVRNRSDSTLSNYSSLGQSNWSCSSTITTNRHTFLSEDNSHSHTNRHMERVCSRQKAQKELDQSISQCREKLTTFIQSNHNNVSHNLPEPNGGDIGTNQHTKYSTSRNSATLQRSSFVKNQTTSRSLQSTCFKSPMNLSNAHLLHKNSVGTKAENKSSYKSQMERSAQNLYDSVSLKDGMKIIQSDDGRITTDNECLMLELEEKKGQIKRLQRIIEHQRELFLRQSEDTQRDGDRRIESIKADYECTINRNYKLIDELIEEKKVLHTKCEEFLEELKTVTKKTNEKIKALEERHKVEMRKVEAKHLAAEKLRREKWETEKAKHFKEVTIRGMENEVAQMIANHKAEMASLRQSCAEQIQAADVRAYQAYMSHIEELKQTLIKEKDEACCRERELVEQRLNQTLAEERNSLEAHKRRLLDEISDERERLALTASKQRAEMDTLRNNLQVALTQANEQHKMEIEQLRADLSQRHKDEIAELNQRNLAERTAWEEHTKSLLESQYTSRETILKEQLKKERDRMLESAVQRLEAEANEARLEIDRQAEVKVKRVREKFQAEIEELERSERQAMEKYCLMKTQFLDKEHEADRLRSQLTQRDQELAEVRLLYEKLNQERQNISDVIRQEFADRLIYVEEENRSMKRELAELKARLKAEQERHEKDIDAIKKLNNSEIETVHLKIKEIIKKKEEKFAILRESFQNELEKKDRELDAANQRAQHLEELIDHQSKQFLQANH